MYVCTYFKISRHSKFLILTFQNITKVRIVLKYEIAYFKLPKNYKTLQFRISKNEQSFIF